MLQIASLSLNQCEYGSTTELHSFINVSLTLTLLRPGASEVSHW